jgi:hypothetical protein
VGDPVESTQTTGTVTITADNIDDAEISAAVYKATCDD